MFGEHSDLRLRIVGVLGFALAVAGCSSTPDAPITTNPILTSGTGASSGGGTTAQGQSGTPAVVIPASAGSKAGAGTGAPTAGTGGPKAGSTASTAGTTASGGTGGTTTPPAMGMWEDPGTAEWTLVPEGEVADKCKLDIAKLKAMGVTHTLAIFRYGKLCYEQGRDSSTMVYSATKSLGGLVTASAAYLTRDVPKTGPGTGTFNDFDMATDWGLNYKQGMQLAYLMSMSTGSSSLMWGGRSFSYDTLGFDGLNSMATVANKALAQDSKIGVANMQAATARLFDKLGMKNSSWDSVTYGSGSAMTLHDMGKLFTLAIHGGIYNKERLIGEDWIYRMTHPPFEDANTSYGEFMWLNHRGHAAGIGGDLSSGSNSPDGDPCSPPAFWHRYPHKMSGSADCYATVAGTKCEQKYDMGNYSAQGLGGQFAIGHPGLDMVITIKDWSGMDGPMGIWAKIRPALVALDPMYKGDEAAFCKAYGGGDYAPDLKMQIQQPPDPP